MKKKTEDPTEWFCGMYRVLNGCTVMLHCMIYTLITPCCTLCWFAGILQRKKPSKDIPCRLIIFILLYCIAVLVVLHFTVFQMKIVLQLRELYASISVLQIYKNWVAFDGFLFFYWWKIMLEQNNRNEQLKTVSHACSIVFTMDFLFMCSMF